MTDRHVKYTHRARTARVIGGPDDGTLRHKEGRERWPEVFVRSTGTYRRERGPDGRTLYRWQRRP